MNIYRNITAILLLFMVILPGFGQKIPKSMLPTEKEKVKFLNEADDFIDDIAEGLQDRQSDAVLHAMRGQTAELANIRMSRNGSPSLSDKVVRKDIVGTGSARGIAMRLYIPKASQGKISKLPLLIYFHGGGWAFGSLNSCASFCDALAAKGSAMVLAVDYSLAPENPYPASLSDCVASFEYALEHVKEWGGSPDLISLGGDSAGGNLALATALYAESNKKQLKVRSLVLFYPVVKAYSDKSASWKEYSRGYGLNSRLMEAFNEGYLSKRATSQAIDKTYGNKVVTNPYISPADASGTMLSQLPPVLLIGAERDILYDQGKAFAEKLKKAGKSVDHITFDGSVHMFITMKGQPTAFTKAVDLTAAFLK